MKKPHNSYTTLALDTSAGCLCAALLKKDGSTLTIAENMVQGKTRSTAIVPLLSKLLERTALHWSEIDTLAFAAGPASFTGLRIAAATLAGINAGYHRPILHLSSLAITAAQADFQGDEPLWVLEDARAGEVFTACYQHGALLHTPRCLNWSEVISQEPAHFTSIHQPPQELAGWQQHLPKKKREVALLSVLKAELDQVTSVTQLPAYPQPNYLQRSQAERNLDAQQQ